MLENKVIVYDDSCPMCKLYTAWFVAWGFLKPENRIGFATAPPEVMANMDLDRGRHEIPLYDRVTNETIYGLSALAFILGSRWTWLKPFFASKLFHWMFHPLYQVITYNRRVIAGCQACDGFDCAPDLNRFYRAVYLVLAGLGVGLAATLLLLAGTHAATAAAVVIVAFVLLTLLTVAIIRLTGGGVAAWDRAGNDATTTVIATLALLPLVAWPAMPAALAGLNILFAIFLTTEERCRRSR